MFLTIRKQNRAISNKVFLMFVVLSFVGNSILPSYAIAQTALNLPAVGARVNVSESYSPAIIKGLKVDPYNPLKFNFIIDTGSSNLSGEELKRESNKLIRYFLSALTVPDDEIWVNLSPVEKDRIIADGLVKTEMGRDMLAQDYLLKQITASLVYPEGELGKKFWSKVRQIAQERLGTTDIPMDTFNKVWIMPANAFVYESSGTAFVIENRLKVMLEEDYLALENVNSSGEIEREETKQVNSIGSQIVREIILPELEKDVNRGKNFANLRQIANAVLLAWWYKQNLRESLLGKVYVGQNKVRGIDLAEKDAKLRIYNQYLEALKVGVYNYIKEDVDPVTKETLPRKYFSGGSNLRYDENATRVVRGALEIPDRERVETGTQPTGEIVNAEAVLVENAVNPGAAAAAEPKEAVVRPAGQRIDLTAEEGAANINFETNGTRASMYEVDASGQRTKDGPFTNIYVARTASATAKVFLRLVASGEWTVKSPERGLRALIAYDARKGASEFAQTVFQSLSAYEGISVDMASDVTTSPDAAFMSYEYDFVVQITASHNPENDNGIKIFTGGVVVQDRIAARINSEANSSEGRAGYYSVPFEKDRITFISAFERSSQRKLNAFGDLEALAQGYRQAHPQAKLYADMMGGAAVPYAPQFEKLGMTVFGKEAMSERQYVNRKGELYAPNPTLAENYGPEFDEFKANAPDGSVWFGLDGDVDRLVVWVKDQGLAVEVDPNNLGMLYADNLIPKLKERAAREGKTLVLVKTLPTSLGLDVVAAKHGVQLFTTPVGSKNFREFIENPEFIVVVATEESGHQVLTINGETFFDDAVTQLYQVITMMGESNKNPARLAADLRTELNFNLVFNNDAIKLEPETFEAFMTRMKENPQAIIDQVESAIGQKAEKIQVVVEDNTVQLYAPGIRLKPEQGLYLLFKNSRLGPWAYVYFRKSGTQPVIRIYRQSERNNDELLALGKVVIGASPAALPASESPLIEDGGDSGLKAVLEVQNSINRMARILTRGSQADDVTKAVESIQTALTRNINLIKVLDDFAETVGISPEEALSNMINAGLAFQAEGQTGKNYTLTSDFYSPQKLESFRQAQIRSSQNPDMVDLSVIRLERILLSTVNVQKFMGDEIFKQYGIDESTFAQRLSAEGIFPTLIVVWNLQAGSRDGAVQELKPEDIIDPAATKYYGAQGISVGFSLPGDMRTDSGLLQLVKAYHDAYGLDMARGQFNYRGTGTRQTIEQYFDDSFLKNEYDRIRNFVASQFPDGLDAIVSDGIGANDQFMWSLMEMYNRNRKEGDPVWYHVITARELDNLTRLNPDRTLGIHISRSGSTWEGVEVASRLVAKGFTKLIVLANGGDLKSIADNVNREQGQRALLVGMQPDIGGRNMHRKTPIYYTIQSVMGLFQPNLDSPVFAKLHHKFDSANDFGKSDSLALNSAKFLHAMIELKGVNHIAFMSNTLQTALIGSELSQYVMEGSNKEHVISWGDHDLASEAEEVLQNFASSPAGLRSVGMAILDKASENFKEEMTRVEAVKERLPLIIFVIDSREGQLQGFNGVTPTQQAAFDILWTDFITALTSFLRVDANSNPNVKVVRQMTKEYVKAWKSVADRYRTDPIGTGAARVLISVGQPGDSEIGVTQKQVSLTRENADQLGREWARRFSEQGVLQGRDRLNVFVGTSNLQSLMKQLRVGAYGSALAINKGWIFETGTYPGRAHKGHEATLAYSEDPAKPLLANKSINIFLNQRSLGDNPFFNEPFLDNTGTGKYADVQGATIHQTNDSMTFPNITRTAQVSPTILFEFEQLDMEIENVIREFYDAFVDELGKIAPDPFLLPGPEKPEGPGGIDLNPNLFNLQIKRDGQGVPLPIYDQPIENMEIDGFVPVIINISPLDIAPLLDAAVSQREVGEKLSYNVQR